MVIVPNDLLAFIFLYANDIHLMENSNKSILKVEINIRIIQNFMGNVHYLKLFIFTYKTKRTSMYLLILQMPSIAQAEPG